MAGCCLLPLMGLHACQKEESPLAETDAQNPVALAKQTFDKNARHFKPDTATLGGLFRESAILRWQDATNTHKGDSLIVHIPVAFATEFRMARADGTKGPQLFAHLRALRIGDAEWQFSLLTWYPTETGDPDRGFSGTVSSEDWFTGKGVYSHVFENRLLRKGETHTGHPRLLMGWEYECGTVPVLACVDGYCTPRERNFCGWAYTTTEEQYVTDNDGGGGPSGGNSGSPGTPINLDIKDKLDEYPCAQALVNQLTTLDNDIANLLSKTFDKNKDYNIHFVADPDLPINVDGEEREGRGGVDWYEGTIALNSFILENASQEYILATMYHEVLHSYLNVEFGRLGNTEFANQYPKVTSYEVAGKNGKKIRKFALLEGHQNFGPYITSLTNAILSFNPKMPFNRARAIAKMGIVKEESMTNQEKLLNGYEKDTSKGNSKGTKCTD